MKTIGDRYVSGSEDDAVYISVVSNEQNTPIYEVKTV